MRETTEPRVLTREELAGMAWLHGYWECRVGDTSELMEVAGCGGYILSVDELGAASMGRFDLDGLLDDGRIWIDRPTEEQRKAVKWDG